MKFAAPSAGATITMDEGHVFGCSNSFVLLDRGTAVVAIDCEMVKTDLNRERGEVARFGIVNMYGNILMESYVKPVGNVVDYVTRYSGIEPHHIADGTPRTTQPALVILTATFFFQPKHSVN